MRAFAETVRFVVRTYLRRVSTWAYFGIFCAIAFLMMCMAGGAWEALDTGGGNELANSPSNIASLVTALSLLGMPVVAALFGNVIYRDYQSGVHPLLFTTPTHKGAFLGGRFVGALIVGTVIFFGIPLGMAVATGMPNLEPDRIGAFRLAAYLQPYLLLVLPNLVFAGAIFFALAALTRQMLPNYIGGVLLLVGWGLAGNLMGDLDDRKLAALLDPFGASATFLSTRYWSVAERNVNLLPVEGLLLYNRLLWVGVGLLVLGALYARFRFSHLAREGRAKQADPAPVQAAYPALRPFALPRATLSFRGRDRVRQYLSLARREFTAIVHNVYFAALVGVGLIFLVFMATQVGEIYGTTTYPVTYAVLETLGGGFALFMLIIITFYAGELVWRERELKAHQVHDALPLPGWIPFASKLTALAGVILALLTVVAVCGLLTQAGSGYFRFELGQYVQQLYVRDFVMYLQLAVLALAIQVLVNHKYLGHLLMILYYVGAPLLHVAGFHHVLYNYGAGGSIRYSDMNGYGHSTEPWIWLNLYWGAFVLLLALVSNLFWVRGEETRAQVRVRLARLRWSRPVQIASGFACLSFVGLGGFVFYNTNVLNDYHTPKADEWIAAEYEKQYKKYDGIPQPRITAADLEVDLYPERRDLGIRGVYRLQNKTDVPVDSVHVNYSGVLTRHDFEFDRAASPVLLDEERGHAIYALESPLLPGDSLTLRFDVENTTRGFRNSVETYPMVENGTFFHNNVLPGIGYNAQAELASDETRRKHGLAPKARMAAVDDPRARMDPYIGTDADWIDFEATVSTNADQIAFAPGALQREWTENGRRYFHYRAERPILNFYSFLSGRYAVRRDRWRDVDIEVYHHPDHEFNVERMIEAVKRSLEYNTVNFGTYPHAALRIVEFPRYSTFAQSFPTLIPFSESIGFIAQVDDEDDIDYAFHTTAHEVAHQWWAHQVIGGNVQGSTLMSESVSEYVALMVMQQEYGSKRSEDFLEYEMDGYLQGRATERKKEMPLLRVENQPYIHYQKGALALYALQDHIGEDRLNAALGRYAEAVRYQEPPYTNSLEFYGYLKAATPDSLQYVLEDWFEHITLYENRAEEATYARLPDGRYEVVLELNTRKMRADSLGAETEQPMNDLVDIGVFAAAPDGEERGPVLYLAKHRIGSGEQEVRVVVDQEPARAGIDPYHKLIDRHGSDNVVKVKEAKS